ncbi:uncharacterized protein K489DRAFT_412626 [Dissoconium aciculare CBS 342.82]|uniref:Uncharacterized protein n=1 Tax=Dissoconium aciculare CBS 342.82 TaxID=1314786 RepID=A0A6J3LWB5_9PEZI|nr:uncharacterized protein K489DRAFT_412626 [Dissoconium aciculare CBS 342.82]KAF1819953.1 hypothetical protein K489DRAFT_412626 [Dissoconium aciculare CBS 342.82]
MDIQQGPTGSSAGSSTMKIKQEAIENERNDRKEHAWLLIGRGEDHMRAEFSLFIRSPSTENPMDPAIDPCYGILYDYLGTPTTGYSHRVHFYNFRVGETWKDAVYLGEMSSAELHQREGSLKTSPLGERCWASKKPPVLTAEQLSHPVDGVRCPVLLADVRC